LTTKWIYLPAPKECLAGQGIDSDFYISAFQYVQGSNPESILMKEGFDLLFLH
jgi:hypothetical protein